MFAGIWPTCLAEPGRRTIASEKMWGDKAACIIISADLGFNRRLTSLFPILNAQLSLAVISLHRVSLPLLPPPIASPTFPLYSHSTLHLWLNVTRALSKKVAHVIVPSGRSIFLFSSLSVFFFVLLLATRCLLSVLLLS